MNRRLLYLATALPLIVILSEVITNCANINTARDPRTVTIAVVEQDPLTDDGGINNQSIYAGVKLAADALQARGGATIQIDVHDDENDPDRAAAIARQIVASSAVAVIGHSSIESLSAAAEVYDSAGIPALNVSPITEHFTESRSYHFNTSYTAETEAAYLANYIRRVNGATTATILSTTDGYSRTIARQFKNTFQGLGGTIAIEREIGQGDSLETIVSDIVSASAETTSPGTIFLATNESTAAELVILMKRKGISYPIAGANSLNSPGFLERIERQPEEISFPGYYTDGILTTGTLIFDSTNRYANQFLMAYQAAFAGGGTVDLPQPGDRVISGYDAATALLTIIQQSDVTGSELQVQADRSRIYNALLDLDDNAQSIQGIIGPLYFEPSQNTTRAPRFGLYQNGELVSANTQFEPIAAPNEVNDLEGQVERGRILTVNGGYVYRANIVYAGIDLLGIDEIDIKTSTYLMDFYLWFRFRPNEQDADFKPEDFIFTNAEGEPDITLIRDEANADGTQLITYRVRGLFKNQFQFQDYPFDHQSLVVEFRSQNATTSFIQYVVDRVGMRYTSDTDLLSNFASNGAFDSLIGWEARGAKMTQDTFPTYSTLGSPQSFDRRVATNYSLINMGVDLRRDALQYIVKSLLPLLITLILAYITFYLPLGHEERLTIGSTALLGTAFFHLAFATTLPEIGYTVAMEYLFYAAYVMCALIVLLETLSGRYEKAIEETKRKSDRQRLQKKRRDLDMFGRIAYPGILLGTLAVGYLIYTGTIQLRQDNANLINLFDSAIESVGQVFVAEAPTQPAPSTSDEVVLSLGTWRPEDTTQIEALIDEFEAYALETTDRRITVDYRPVMSVNYDSILEQQLSLGEGPDLLYVRPFSVDGHIIRYLMPLNEVLPLERNFDETKLTPWTNSGSGFRYAMPFVGVVQGVYYNKAIFERNFLDVPQTWEDFKRIAAALQAAGEGLIPIANALNQNEDSEMFMSIAANYLGGPEGRERFMRTDGTSLCYDDVRVVRAFQAIEDIEPYLPPNAAFINSQTSKELFLSGQAAMLFGGSWDLQKISEEAGFEWDVFAVPAPFFSSTYVIFQPDIGIGINNATTHPEEAALFLEWLTSEEAVTLMAQKLPGFYPLNRIEVSRGSNPNDAKFLALVNNYPDDIRWMYTEISSKSPSALEIIREDLHRMIAFDLSAEDAAADLQAGLGEWYEPAQSCAR
jgi:branched-chain amino acid transport system substrate-binding protein